MTQPLKPTAKTTEPGATKTTEPGATKATKPGATQTDDRARAYRAAAQITREQLRRDAPEKARVLDAVEKSDVVVVRGCYDRVEDVLAALEVDFTVCRAAALDRLALRPEQLLVINCPGQVSAHAITRIRAFVEAGGSLFTTDWALKHVIEPAFPGVLAFNERPTADDVVRIEVKDPDNIYLQGVIDGRDDPLWWLEGSSYPIRVVDPERVQVLITSKELGEKYGEEPVAVWFRWGEGEVFHMISHYYLQRTELRTERHGAGAAVYFGEKGVPMTAAMRAEYGDLALSEVESAKPSAAFMSNVLIDKKERALRLQAMTEEAARRQAEEEAAQLAAEEDAARLAERSKG
ncbi:MAG: hypothetical protein JW767_08835, partial [Thermoleophilia bacterium]|nr:hypothetical protein [Thermoleophilia bacterium]